MARTLLFLLVVGTAYTVANYFGDKIVRATGLR